LRFVAARTKTTNWHRMARLTGKALKNTKQPKRATGLADRELAHLEAMFNGLHQRIDAFARMPANYWVQRVRRIEDEYALVVTQQKRLAMLMRTLECLSSELEPTPDHTALAA